MRAKRTIGKKIAMHNDLRRFVEKHLMDDQAPEEIAKRLKRIEKGLPYVFASAIRDTSRACMDAGLNGIGARYSEKGAAGLRRGNESRENG